MTALRNEVIAGVAEALAEVGEPVTIIETGTLDTSTGAVSTGPSHAVALASPAAPYKSSITGQSDESGDVQIVVKGAAAIGFTPKKGWSVVQNGVTFSIVDVENYLNGAAFILRCAR